MELDGINRQIENALLEAEVDTELLKTLVKNRESLIVNYLESASSQEGKKFAEDTLDFQKKLEKQLNNLFNLSKEDLSKVITARKISSKYK